MRKNSPQSSNQWGMKKSLIEYSGSWTQLLKPTSHPSDHPWEITVRLWRIRVHEIWDFCKSAIPSFKLIILKSLFLPGTLYFRHSTMHQTRSKVKTLSKTLFLVCFCNFWVLISEFLRIGLSKSKVPGSYLTIKYYTSMHGTTCLQKFDISCTRSCFLSPTIFAKWLTLKCMRNQ